ncbi:WD40-repeat-containing domain protein, partial [Schizophyllum fasciatum]
MAVARLRRSVNERVQELHQRLQKVMDDVESGKHLDTQNAIFRVEDIVTRLDIDNTLSHLPVAEGMQAGSSKACLPNTRVKLLEAIMDWVFAPKGPRCFVLHGTAGKGKSAVAHSVASVLRGMGVVAPFFAFDRSDRARQASQLFPTLAQQLARYDRRYLERLRALRTEQLKTTDIQDQYDNLMSTTLQVSVVLAPVVFVIDALDECPNSDVGDIENRDVLLKALRKCLGDESLHRNVRFFVTTRPEQDIRLLGPSNGISITWKSIDDDEGTKADIEKFVASRLPDSSASDLVTTISEAAQDHFECAAILCRELTRPKKPMTVGKRAQLIARVKTQPGRPLYKTYRVILETHLDTKDEDCLNIYRQLLAWVFAVRQPQPRSVFLEIAAVVFPEETIEDILEGLGSLLTGTTLTSGDDTPIRPLHASFRDFCLDAEESGIFSIAPDFGTVDARLALACFQLMSRPALGLRLNICDLPSLFVFKDDVSDLAERVAKHISPALQYACRETSAHLLACAQGVEQMKVYAELDNFLTKRFLFWLEACGWLNSPPSLALQGCSRYLRSINASDLVAVVDDCIAFEKRFRGAISSSPTQIYISGPLFSPLSSHVFRSRETLPMEVSGFDAEQHWPLNEALAGDTLQEHEHQVLSVAFSRDGTRIVSGSLDNTIRVWDADATTQVGEAFRGHEGPVISVAFSLDGTRIATGSIDATVRIWDAATGHPMGSAGLHESIVHSVAFSPNGRRIVSGSDDRTIRIWDAETGQQVGAPLHGHEDRVRSVAFSPDGTRIVSGSEDRTVRVWYAEAGHSPVGGVSRDAHWAYAIAFAPDGTKMISGSDDKSVRVWDTETGQQIGDALRGHDGPVVAVACLPNGSRVQMGDVLSGHRSSVHSVAYSPRGTLIASGSSDMMIRLWDAKAKQQVGKALRGHEGVVLSIAFSPGAALIASGSADETVRIWDVST